MRLLVVLLVSTLAGCIHDSVAACQPYSCTRGTLHPDLVRNEAQQAFEKPREEARFNVQLIVLDARLDPKEVALAVCGTNLSYRGMVTVVGNTLVIEEADDNIARARKLIAALGAPADGGR